MDQRCFVILLLFLSLASASLRGSPEGLQFEDNGRELESAGRGFAEESLAAADLARSGVISSDFMNEGVVEVSLQFTLDEHPSETGWRIETMDGLVVYRIPPGIYSSRPPFSSFTEILSLNRGQQYSFFVEDSVSDNGLQQPVLIYLLAPDSKDLVALYDPVSSVGTFAFGARFNTWESQLSFRTDVTLPPFSPSFLSVSPPPSRSMAPSVSPVSLRPTPVGDPGEKVLVVIRLDGYPAETGWRIEDSTGNVLHQMPAGTYAEMPPYSTVSLVLNLASSQDYKFYLEDSFGDGFTGIVFLYLGEIADPANLVASFDCLYEGPTFEEWDLPFSTTIAEDPPATPKAPPATTVSATGSTPDVATTTEAPPSTTVSVTTGSTPDVVTTTKAPLATTVSMSGTTPGVVTTETPEATTSSTSEIATTTTETPLETTTVSITAGTTTGGVTSEVSPTTTVPTSMPSVPAASPSAFPSDSRLPSQHPTISPSGTTIIATSTPSASSPSAFPSDRRLPSQHPTTSPSGTPVMATSTPSAPSPSAFPSDSRLPSQHPTTSPSGTAVMATSTPSASSPSAFPSDSRLPSQHPTTSQSATPSVDATAPSQSGQPSVFPTGSASPSSLPTVRPSYSTAPSAGPSSTL